MALRTANSISQETGLSPTTIGRLFKVTRATPAKPEFIIRVPEGMIEEQRVSRGLARRKFDRRDRDAGDTSALSNLITSKDDKVCPICERISKEGPYSPEQMADLKRQHPHLLNVAMGCRCALAPFRERSRMRVTVRQGQTSVESRTTLKELAAAIRRNTRVVLRAK